MSTRAPKRRPVVTWPALLIAIALVGLAVVAVRDLAVAQGWASGERWSETLLSGLDGLTAGPATTTVGVLAALIGLALILTVLRPARRTHLPTPASEAEVWISRRALRQLAEDAVQRVPGVESVSASAGRRLTVRATAVDESARGPVEDAVKQAVGGYLTTAPKITVRKATP